MPGAFSCKNVSSHVKRSPLLWLHTIVPFTTEKNVYWFDVLLVFRINK